jgi:benzoylformate decarboxylase
MSNIVEEAPSSHGPMHDYLPIIREDGFYTCASGGLGHGLPAAIGVALGRPAEKVIAFLGDRSSLYAIQGLWSAAQLRLPISFPILTSARSHVVKAYPPRASILPRRWTRRYVSRFWLSIRRWLKSL